MRISISYRKVPYYMSPPYLSGKALELFRNGHGVFRIRPRHVTEIIQNVNLPTGLLGGYQNKKMGKNRKGLTFLRAFKGRL